MFLSNDVFFFRLSHINFFLKYTPTASLILKHYILFFINIKLAFWGHWIGLLGVSEKKTAWGINPVYNNVNGRKTSVLYTLKEEGAFVICKPHEVNVNYSLNKILHSYVAANNRWQETNAYWFFFNLMIRNSLSHTNTIATQILNPWFDPSLLLREKGEVVKFWGYWHPQKHLWTWLL